MKTIVKKISELEPDDIFRYVGKTIWYEFDFKKDGAFSYADIKTGLPFYTLNGDALVEVQID